MDYNAWNDIYTELPSKQVKVAVSDKSKLICSEDETHLLSPASLQEELNQAMRTAGNGRIFIRPSGTEDVVRIYAEANTKEEVNSLVELSKNALNNYFASLA
jgi:phosphoacetylglucosamine mutase